MTDSSAPESTGSASEPQPVLRDEFVRMLLCPVSKQPLHLADAAIVASLNAAIAAGRVRTVGGDKLEETVDAVLLREDGQMAYSVVGRIPRLTKEEGVAASQFLAK